MFLKVLLEQMDTSLRARKELAEKLTKSPRYLEEATELITDSNARLSVKALMVIEVLSRDHFELLHSYIPEMIHAGSQFTDSPARRCLSKLYGLAITKDGSPDFRLASELKKEIIELSFRWLMDDGQTAVKVFSMQNLYELRSEESWIPEELKAIIQKELPNSTPGFKSMGVKILRKMEL